jgi:hypothetical protein
MAKKTITLHMYESTGDFNVGERLVISQDWRENPNCMKDRIWLGSQDVQIDIPEIDTRQAQIDALGAQIQQERADSQIRVNRLLDRISKLQAIGHDG